MAIAVATDIMPLSDQLPNDLRETIEEFPGEEEGSLDLFLVQGLDNRLGAIGLVGCREDQGQLLTGRIGTDNAALHIDILIGRSVRLSHPLLLQGREGIGEAGRAIHRRLIGGIVANRIVIDHQIRLELSIVLTWLVG